MVTIEFAVHQASHVVNRAEGVCVGWGFGRHLSVPLYVHNNSSVCTMINFNLPPPPQVILYYASFQGDISVVVSFVLCFIVEFKFCLNLSYVFCVFFFFQFG